MLITIVVDLHRVLNVYIIDLQKVKQQVVKEIKSNQQLEHDLDQMDVKIGLLIKNRITLQVYITKIYMSLNMKLHVGLTRSSSQVYGFLEVGVEKPLVSGWLPEICLLLIGSSLDFVTKFIDKKI